MILDEFDRLYGSLAEHDGERFLCLACTANVNNPPVLVGSSRLFDGVLAGNLILREIALLPGIVKRFEAVVAKFFIDCEIKAGVDLGAAVQPLIAPDKRHFFKPNDFTVEAADEWIAQRMPDLRGTRAAIVGAGNIGAKLALRLAERGNEVRLVARSIAPLKRTVEGLSAIMRGSGSITAVPDVTAACLEAGLIVGCTPGTPAIDAPAVIGSKAVLLLDVGNGCFTHGAIAAAQQRDLALEVLSPTAGWEGFMRRYFATRKIQQGLGRRQLESGVWVVSRGIMGAAGDVLVDDVSKPRRVIGVCNGVGDLLYGEEAMQRMKYVEESLGIV
jgi:hypothetical protein